MWMARAMLRAICFSAGAFACKLNPAPAGFSISRAQKGPPMDVRAAAFYTPSCKYFHHELFHLWQSRLIAKTSRFINVLAINAGADGSLEVVSQFGFDLLL